MESPTSAENPGDMHSLSVRKRRGTDSYCWICHDSTNIKLDSDCHRCGRAFHFGCDARKTKDGKAPKEPLPPGFSQYQVSSLRSTCTVCYHIKDETAKLAPSELPELNRALNFVCDKLIDFDNSQSLILYPDDESKIPKYRELIVNPMTLDFLKRKAQIGGFTSAEEFLYDFKLIQHNAIISNKRNNKIVSFANALYEIGFKEYCKISYCYQCYVKSVVDGVQIYSDDQFLVACNRPHGLVWAETPGQGYKPAKIINFSSANINEGKTVRQTKYVSSVDVCVFGSREVLTNLKMDDCFVYSQKAPTGISVAHDAATISELKKYIESVNDIIANPKCAIQLERVDSMVPKEVSKLTLDGLYLIKKIKPDGFKPCHDPIVDVSATPARTSVPSPNVQAVVSIKSSSSGFAAKRVSSFMENGSKSKRVFKLKSLPIKITIDPSHFEQFLKKAPTSPSFEFSASPSAVDAYSDVPPYTAAQTKPASVNNAQSNASEIPSSATSSPTAHSFSSASKLTSLVEIKQEPIDNIIPLQSISTLPVAKTAKADESNPTSASSDALSVSDYAKQIRFLETLNKNKIAIIEELKRKCIEQDPSAVFYLSGKWCHFCYQTRIKNFLCCNDTYYCSRECQHDHWEQHEPACTQGKEPPNE